MKKIPLTKGYFAIVDDNDFELVAPYKWRANENFNSVYAVTSMVIDGKRKGIYMHRFLLNVSAPDLYCDHKNRNGIDNRRKNLRICTNSQNQMNQRKRKDNTSGFKGVSLFKITGKFRAAIRFGGKKICIGYFKTAELAALAYNEKAKELHGDFAHLNKVGPC